MTSKTLRRALALAAAIATLGVGVHAQLGSRTADEWVATLDTPARIESLKINDVVSKLRLRAGNVVADIGAGTGLFEGALAAAVGARGIVYAEDVDQKLIDHIAARAKTINVANVRTVLGTFTDPRLPSPTIDVAFINDVLHHIEGRDKYLRTLAGYLKPGGRIVVIEFHPELGGHRTQPELQIARAQGDALLAGAGFKPVEVVEMFTEKWFVIYGR
jgi:ubiquinone/menaquinone biosynthesis C-methylase UbiE